MAPFQVFLPLLISSLFLICNATSPLSTSHQASLLLSFKAQLSDTANSLRNWNGSDPCSWTGVTCTTEHLVQAVNFSNFNLQAQPDADFTSLCSIPTLTSIDLTFNAFSGTFPPTLYKCTALQTLILSANYYVGSLPGSIDSFVSLSHLDLSLNNFNGIIPPSFGRLPHLVYLSLINNLLNDTIPPFLGNLSKLQVFDLAYNPFSNESTIPLELGNLTELTTLFLASCNLHGSIPNSLGNLLKLSNLDLSTNMLTGEIPDSLTNLRSLTQLELYRNQLHGPIPVNIGNLSRLHALDLSVNNLTGEIPPSISELQNLHSFHVYNNLLSGSLPPGIALIPSLTEMYVFKNTLSGMLPQNFGAVSPNLLAFDVSNNNFMGPLPPKLCSGGVLQILVMMYNNLDGSIPSGYGDCHMLQRLRLNNNRLSGRVPSALWSLPALFILELDNNKLEGEISSDIGHAHNLSILKLENNLFSGNLPVEMFAVRNLSVLSLGSNNFSGTIPSEIGNSLSLTAVCLHSNSFSGEIPASFNSRSPLSILQLAGNQLTGPIPPSLANLSDINLLNLSHNHLSGSIPACLSELRLTEFDVSYNSLSGSVPLGLASAAFDEAFKGNPGLCGPNLVGITPCIATTRKAPPKLLLRALLVATFGTAFILLVVGLMVLYRLHGPHVENILMSKSSRRRGELGHNSVTNPWRVTSFQKAQFTEPDILAGLDEKEVIGSGGSGRVYKVVLSTGQTVAVKKLKAGTNEGIEDDKGFKAEVATLGKIRHKNIVKLLCCCSNKDTKLLVYEYMPNGSLGDVLHNTGFLGKESRSTNLVLDWPTRYKIALGAAQGLAYLHHDCSPPIVHRDVKSNNILLDAELNAYVSDFGVAKVMSCYLVDNDDTLANCSGLLTTRVAGSYGYIAPEHAYTPKVTEKSDIYSFGVVLLELLTGKKPVASEVFGDNIGIVRWVRGRLVMAADAGEVLDPGLAACWREGMLLVLRIALLCTSALPVSRPSMRDVVEMLVDADPPRNSSTPLKTSKSLGASQTSSYNGKAF